MSIDANEIVGKSQRGSLLVRFRDLSKMNQARLEFLPVLAKSVQALLKELDATSAPVELKVQIKEMLEKAEKERVL